jgi:hypothetical protein
MQALKAFTTLRRFRAHRPAKWKKWMTLGVLIACAASSAQAYDPLDFVPEQVPAARLSGEATMRRYGVPAYTATLFIDPGSFSPQDLTRESFALDFEYVVPCKGAGLASSFAAQMDDMSLASSTQIGDWRTQLRHFLPDIAPDQHLTAVFGPGRGTRFYRNGELFGAIAGDDFARAFFGIWLDDTTAMPDIRQGLLTGSH